MRFQRCRELFLDDRFEKIKQAKVIIIGVGGVGSYALDCLYRTGVQNITIVDYDTYDITNQNRQIGSFAVGKSKVQTLQTLYPTISFIEKKVDETWVNEFDFSPFDIIIDACDTTKVKLALAKKCYPKLIMAVGSAKRFDATKITTASIWKTHGDALASKIRRELKKAKFDRNFTVVFSSEEAKCKTKGSFVGVTGAFGLHICSEAIKKIVK